MTNNQLHTFLCIVDCGSFSKAAEKLFVSKQALIKQINLLEEEIGTELILRDQRGVTLTPAGQEMYTGAQQILQLTTAVKDNCQKAAAENSIIIASESDLPMPVLSKARRQFDALYPGTPIGFKIMPMRMFLDAVRSRSVSMCIHAYCPQIEEMGLCFTPIVKQPISCVFSYFDPLLQRETVTLDDLQGRDVYICDRAEYFEFIDYIENERLNINLDPLAARNMYEIVYIFYLGGVLLLPRIQAEHYAPKFSRPLASPVELTLGIVYRPHPYPLLQKFIETARQTHNSVCRIYPEPPIVRALADNSDSARNEEANFFFKRVHTLPNTEIIISDLTIAEIRDYEEPLRTQIMTRLQAYGVKIISETPKDRNIMKAYLTDEILSGHNRAALRHIAIAAGHGCSFIITWDFMDFCNLPIQSAVNDLHAQSNLQSLHFLPPTLLLREINL